MKKIDFKKLVYSKEDTEIILGKNEFLINQIADKENFTFEEIENLVAEEVMEYINTYKYYRMIHSATVTN